MFTSARLLKDHVYAKSKLAQQMHRWDGLFESTTAILALKPVCNRFDFMPDAGHLTTSESLKLGRSEINLQLVLKFD